ncbi:MAG TPA: glycosyltransferase family 39 protein [Acidobacteriaceae bacterium]|nr:glycosyltransferase family 39 protein [Acidobacteriaceae bacterium]
MMTPKPAATSSRTNRWVTAAVLALLLVLSAQIIHAIHGQSLTWDEDDHIFAGYESWKTHDFGLNPEHPPMVKQLATLPLLPLHLNVPPLQNRFFKSEAYLDGQQLLYHNGPADGGRYSVDTLVFRARLPTLFFAIAAALLVFFATREMFNVRAALFALTLFCFDPNLLAFGAYVTTDMAASCTIFATIYALWRYVQRPTPGRLVVTGIAAGIALAAKHSTVLLAPMLVLLLAGELAARALSARRPRDTQQTNLARTALQYVTALAVITLIGVAVLWAFYGFRYAARPAGLTLSPSLTDYVGPLAGIEARGILFAARFHLLPESYLYGLADVRKMANDMPSFFFGHVYEHGIWYYFPVVFVIKSTLSLLAALALTLFAIARGWLRNPRALWFLIAPPTLYFAVAMSSHLNIGARHILPVWVFCCVLAGAGLSALIQHNHRWIYPVAALLLFQIATTLHAAPDYIAYSNEAWGGPTHTYRYLSDSNTDWGQQLLATSAYVRDHHITHCYFAYFVTPFVLPTDHGIPCTYLPTPDSFGAGVLPNIPATIDTATDGPILISAGDLNYFESGSSVLNPYQSLMNVHPSAYIQDGVLVFNGRFTLPLAAALPHVDRAWAFANAHNNAAALHEAILAESLAPNAVQPEIVLGDTEAAAGNKEAARQAYARAITTINTMDPDARDKWLAPIQKKLAAL